MSYSPPVPTPPHPWHEGATGVATSCRYAHRMETALHRQLKELYAGDAACREVRLQGYRIDALVGSELIEIQQGSLGALRDKVRTLLAEHRVTIVKPLVARKQLIWLERKQGAEASRRWSSLHETVWHLFADLVHFCTVFPHPRLTLEVLLTEQAEHRVRKARRRYRGPNYTVCHRELVRVVERTVLRTAEDILALLPSRLAYPCTTAELAQSAGVPRWLAQKIAYCLRTMGVWQPCGKRRNAWLYELAKPRRRPRAQRRAA